MRTQNFNKLALVSVLTLLGACGGGNPPADPPAPPPTPTGALAPATAGVSYASPSFSGVTDENGRFEYAAGETITFSVGELELGRATASAAITLFDLVGIANPPTNKQSLQREIDEGLPMFNLLGLSFGAHAPGPMSRVINLAVLLESIDADGDPANGIRVPAAAARAVGDWELDLGDDYRAFANDPRLIRIRRGFAASGELTPAPVPEPGRALARAYSAAGFELESTFYTRRVTDGAIESFLDRNDAGQVVRWGFAAESGAPLRRELRTEFNANGTVLRETTAASVDGLVVPGELERDKRYERDAFGAITRAYSVAADGTETDSYRVEYDTFGLPIRKEHSNGDVEIWLLDPQGMRTGYERFSAATMTTTQREEYEVDALNRWLVKRVYDPATGVITEIHERTFRGVGPLRSQTLDAEGDGTIETQTLVSYDDRGRVIQRLSLSVGQSAAETFEYNDAGALVTYTSSADIDRAPDRVETYSYDDDGLLSGRVVETRNSETYEQRQIRGESGRIERFERLDAAGSVTASIAIEYGEDGRLLHVVDVTGGVENFRESYFDHVAIPLGHGFHERH